MRTNYIENDIEEDIDMINQFKTKNLPHPQQNSGAVCKSYVDRGLSDLSIIRNTAHVDFNDTNSNNVRFIKLNRYEAIGEHAIANHVDQSIDEPTVVRKNQDNAFSILNLTNMNSITLNTQAAKDNQVITKAYVDEFHQEGE